MVTCIDISSLFKEKRTKAIGIVNFLRQVEHENIVQIYNHSIIDERLIYVEMEMPLNLTLWKTFCKKKFTAEEIFVIIKHITQAVEFLH